MFIQTEPTPNPNTFKFLPGRAVFPEGGKEFTNAQEAQASPLAANLFALPGVTGVFFGQDFISVSQENYSWDALKPAILGVIMEHFLSGAPLFTEPSPAFDLQKEFYDPSDEPIVKVIKELLETRIRPAVASDGGDITFRGYDKGVVYLSMRGACAGCPSSTATLKHGIENLLRHFIPDIVHVEAMK